MDAFAIGKVNVFVSILPQKYFVEQVGKDLVSVEVMVGPGQNPATYEPTPHQMADISNAQIYFGIGVPFELAWLPTIRKNNKQLHIVDCCENLIGPSISDHNHHATEINDPHIWTSPKIVIRIVEQIAEQLILIDENNAEIYHHSANQFIEKLISLDREIKRKTKNLKKKDLIVSHPAWSYFSREYGLFQIPIEQHGKEIQASSMTRLIKIAKDKKIRAVYVQPQFNNKAAEIIARELGAKIISLDPLAFNYIENMNYVTDRIVEGLSYE